MYSSERVGSGASRVLPRITPPPRPSNAARAAAIVLFLLVPPDERLDDGLREEERRDDAGEASLWVAAMSPAAVTPAPTLVARAASVSRLGRGHRMVR